MQTLLRELGFTVNERTRRCACLIHGGSNSSAFAWTDSGLWRCHSCGRGGDKLRLVQEVKGTGFKDALRFIAVLAGVNLDNSRKFQEELARARRERRKREADEARLKAIERRAFLEGRDEVLGLEGLRRSAWRRLAELADWGFLDERFPEEQDVAWQALELVARQMPRAAATYTVIAFGDSETRARFATHPEERTGLVDRCIEVGGVVDDKRHFRGLVL